jgi:transaldolase
MTTNPLRDLERCSQSVWLDSISRDLIRSGTFARLIAEDGISGVTANPSIFEKAIVGSHDYDKDIRTLGAGGYRPLQIYEKLAIQDVGTAADMLRATYDGSAGRDGFASIEVSPELAYDTGASIAEARRFWQELNRPNVMVKIPATPEGIPAIEQLTAEGVNVNITLIFAVARYAEVMEAYLTGLEQRVAEGQAIGRISSVASFFVSRVDTMVDSLLDEHARGANGARSQALKGKIAVANARIGYEQFERIFESERFTRLEQHGAQLQRPLWASTSTKNPSYSDTMYVDPLVGPNSVNTMPMETIDAVRDHGHVTCDAIQQGVGEAHQVIHELEQVGISLEAVTDELTRDGVDKFRQALRLLLNTIEEREGRLARA